MTEEHAYIEWKAEQYKHQDTEEEFEFVEHLHNFPRHFKKTFLDGYHECQKEHEWHYLKDGDLPTDTTVLYLVRVYSWDFGFSHLYKKNGTYIPTVCEWNGEYFKALDSMAYSNARNINSCIAWKEIVLPKEIE